MGPQSVKPLVPRGRALRVDGPLPHVASRTDEPAHPGGQRQEHPMHEPDNPIPAMPEPTPDDHLEADYDDRHELGED